MPVMRYLTGLATLILASRSARRAQLLRDAGYEFEQVQPPFADPPSPGGGLAVSPAGLTGELAAKKATSALKLKELRDRPGLVVLGADTICVAHDGRLLGQPVDRDEARRMICSFIGRSHHVWTGIALMRNDKPAVTLTDEAEVRFGPLDDDRLDAYLAGEAWRGKAGGYNLFERQADGWPITVRGDATTVVGLPMHRMERLLANLAILPTASQRLGGP